MHKKKLMEERAKLIKDAQNLANAEDFDQEKNEQYEKMMAQAKALKTQIDAITQSEVLAAELEQNHDDGRRAGQEDIRPEHDKAQEKETAYNGAFDKYMRFGMNALTPQETQALQNGYASLPQAAMSTGVGSEGGYLVPEGFMASVERAELDYNGVLEAGATVLNTETGNDVPWPTQNDTANKGRIIGENVQANDEDMAFGSATLKAFTYTTDVIRIPNTLLQDSAINLDALVADISGERIGRAQNEHFTTGDGVNAPEGFITVAPVGPTAAAAAAVTFEELQDLKNAVKRPYRQKGVFMFNDNTFNFIVKMKDGENRPLFLPSMRDGEPDRLLGRPYVLNDDMDDMATGIKSIVYGDFSKYKVRRVSGGQLLRLSERYADYNQTAFILFRRADGRLLDAGTNPLKVLQQA